MDKILYSTGLAKMPLFRSKFSPKLGDKRKSPSLSNLNLDATERMAEFGPEYGAIKLKLGGNEISFDEGEWVTETVGAASQRDVVKLKKQNQQLNDENNLLKIKVELLLDMLSTKTAEMYLQENTIDQLKKMPKQR